MLEVKNLKTEIFSKESSYPVVDQISFSLANGRTLGIVGESGCGKTMTSLSILQLISPPGQITGGQIFFQNQDLLQVSKKELHRIRGSEIAMIFQEPMAALNPVFTIGEFLESTIRLHHKEFSAEQVRNRCLEVLAQVLLPDPDKIRTRYPHELSGGQQQRVLIAMAISCDPKLLIADEPTTALDVTIQSQILSLLKKLKQDLQLSLILITHDLGVIAEMCDEVLVMYAGQIIESGNVNDIFSHPKHPYTRALIESMPGFRKDSKKLKSIPGSVPTFESMPSGCRFYDRCAFRQDICVRKNPILLSQSQTQKAACHFPLKKVGA